MCTADEARATGRPQAWLPPNSPALGQTNGAPRRSPDPRASPPFSLDRRTPKSKDQLAPQSLRLKRVKGNGSLLRALHARLFRRSRGTFLGEGSGAFRMIARAAGGSQGDGRRSRLEHSSGAAARTQTARYRGWAPLLGRGALRSPRRRVERLICEEFSCTAQGSRELHEHFPSQRTPPCALLSPAQRPPPPIPILPSSNPSVTSLQSPNLSPPRRSLVFPPR